MDLERWGKANEGTSRKERAGSVVLSARAGRSQSGRIEGASKKGRAVSRSVLEENRNVCYA